MPDTVRTDPAILALLADNTAGQISAQDMRDLYVTVLSKEQALQAAIAAIGSGIVNNTPDAFSFTDVADATLSTAYTQSFVISGINVPVIARSTGSINISVNGGAFGVEFIVQNGDTITARIFSSNSQDTALSGTVTVGTRSASWQVVTGQLPPIEALDPANFRIGVNLAGAEFGSSTLPGTPNITYTFPNVNGINYWLGKGVKHFRIPFRWERQQVDLNGPLDEAHLNGLKSAISTIHAGGGATILDIHNFGGRVVNGVNYKIDATELPRSAYLDFLVKLAVAFDNVPGIIAWDHNEPSGLPGGAAQWKSIMQDAVTAIRDIDTVRAILIPGYFFNKMHQWTTHSNDYHEITDPANNLIFSAHAYFDANTSGTYSLGGGSDYVAEGAKDDRGFLAAQNFLDWLDLHSVKGHIGEFGVPGDHATYGPQWNRLNDAFLQEVLARHPDSMVSLWAGGHWWASTYALRAHPDGNLTDGFIDREQAKVLFDNNSVPSSTLANTAWSIVASSATPEEGNPITFTLSWTAGAIQQGERAVITFTEGGTANFITDFNETLASVLGIEASNNDDGLIFYASPGSPGDGRLYIHSGVTSPITFVRNTKVGTAGNTYSITIDSSVGTDVTPTASVTIQSATGEVNAQSSPAASADDARQNTSSGGVAINETTVTATTDRIQGWRFPDLLVAQGVTIIEAKIQFTAGATNSDGCTLRFYGFAVDNIAVFSTATNDISNRAITTTFVDWIVPDWTSGQRTSIQLSPDINTIIQEIVDRVGWVSGNAIGIRTERIDGTGTRTMVTFDHATLDPPTLTVRYATA